MRGEKNEGGKRGIGGLQAKEEAKSGMGGRGEGWQEGKRGVSKREASGSGHGEMGKVGSNKLAGRGLERKRLMLAGW